MRLLVKLFLPALVIILLPLVSIMTSCGSGELSYYTEMVDASIADGSVAEGGEAESSSCSLPAGRFHTVGEFYTAKTDLYVISEEGSIVEISENSITDEYVEANCDDADDIAVSGGCEINISSWPKDLELYISESQPVSWVDGDNAAGWSCSVHASNRTKQIQEFSLIAKIYCINTP